MGNCLAPKPNALDTTQNCLMGQLLQFLIKPDFAKAKPDVILAQGTCGQLSLDLEAEQRKALAMNGDVPAWPEGGASPDTSTWAGSGHRRPSMVPRNALTGEASSLLYSQFLLAKKKFIFLSGGFRNRQLESQG